MKKLNPYLPGIVLFITALLIALATYQDYGIAWDEPAQRYTAQLSYKYAFEGNDEIFKVANDYHGPAFEIVLLYIENKLHITDSRDIYLMRHLASHIFFLIALLCGYVLFYRLFNSRVIACLGFIMLLLMPRIYAHSFFNSKDVPFLGMTIIIFTLSEAAFRKNKAALFIALGVACGYTTAIRTLGTMFAAFTLFFLLIDTIVAAKRRKGMLKQVINAVIFVAGYCGALYASWPYLWRTPVHNFIEGYKAMIHYSWEGEVFFKGQLIPGNMLPAGYFPTWFALTTPVLWLIAGIAGLLVIIAYIIRRPFTFTGNTRERNFLFYLLCFTVPIISVIAFRAVIYDDWRHLYFVYPAFVLLALYVVSKVASSRFAPLVIGACALQVIVLCCTMVKMHPFQQVYFSEFASYKEEYLHNNYELEYWGCSFKQALDTLIAKEPWATIKVSSNRAGGFPMENNILMLQERDRKRIVITPIESSDYMITNFRLAQLFPPYINIVYAVRYHNNTILSVYKMH